jgi:CHAD domain-containing protein
MQRVENAPGVERLSAHREALRLALAEYLLGSVPLAPRAPDAPLTQPSEGVLHLTRQVETQLERLRRHREFWRDEDPVEAVHQLRVASRRLRVFVDLFSHFSDSRRVRRSKRQLEVITQAVRDLQDADVMLQNLQERRDSVSGDEESGALGHVIEKALSRRDKVAKKARARVGAFELDDLGAGLRRILDDVALRARAQSTTYELLAELAFDRVLDETRRSFPTFAHLPRAEELHRFRLQVKKLRYAAELVEPVLGSGFLPIHRRTKQVQELLGDHQDRVVLVKTLERHRNRIAKQRLPTSGFDRLIVRVEDEREQLFQRFSNEYEQSFGPHLFAR